MNQLKTIIPTGIQRNSPLGTGINTDELINMRYHNSAWEPVGQKEELYPDPGYNTIVVHRMDSATNWIGHNAVTDPNKVYWYNPATLEILQTFNLNGTEKVLDIRFLKRFLKSWILNFRSEASAKNTIKGKFLTPRLLCDLG